MDHEHFRPAPTRDRAGSLLRRRRPGSPSGRPRRCCPRTTSTCSTRCAPAPTCAAGSWRSQPETADAATIVIRPGADWAGHVPGQYVRIGIDVDGVRQWRAYSLTHGPRADGRISITVKAVPERQGQQPPGPAAPRPGTLVHLEQAAGEFVLPDRAARKLLFVTAGSGITPVIGMLRNLFPVADSGVVRLARSAGYDITVVHVAPSEPDSIFIANLRALDEAGLIRLVARYDDEHGVLDVADLADLVPDLPSAPPSPAGRPACSTRSRRTTTSAASRCSPSSSGSPRSPPARAAPSPSPAPARPSRPTAPPRSSTPPRTPAC